MTSYSTETVAAVLLTGVLGPADGPLTEGEISRAVDLTIAAVKRPLAHLETEGLAELDGRRWQLTEAGRALYESTRQTVLDEVALIQEHAAEPEPRAVPEPPV